jgi:hypothetical protein
MADLLNGGMLNRDTTSCASTRPRESINGTSSASGWHLTLSKIFSASSIGIIIASGSQGALLKNRPLDPYKTFYYTVSHRARLHKAFPVDII